MIKFGPAGNCESFYAEGHKGTIETPKWISEKGLDCFEYSFGRGTNLSLATADLLREEFNKYNIEISVHAPYFINFSNENEEMIQKSFAYITNSLDRLKHLGGERCVFHPATQGKLDRKTAFNICLINIHRLVDLLYDKQLSDFKICAEAMGKIAQIGTVDEIIEICKIDKMIYPCMDFGHINAREQGSLKSASDYENIIKKMLDELGEEKTGNMHIHFSKIMYTKKGEVKHLTFDNDIENYGPNFEPLAEILVKYGLNPYVICESSGTQAEDALKIKKMYKNCL